MAVVSRHAEVPGFVLVTGSRAFRDRQLMGAALDRAWQELRSRGFGELVLVHGGAAGADRQANDWAVANGVKIHRFRLTDGDWASPCTRDCKPGHRRPRKGGGTYCPAVGHHRNQRMVDHVLQHQAPHGALAAVFYAGQKPSPGTWDCHQRIAKACMPYRVFTSQRAGGELR